jgi:hypothetical protein
MKTTCLFFLVFFGFHTLSYCQGAYQKSYDLAGTAEFRDAALTVNKSVITTGKLQTSYAHIYVFLLKLDSSGNSQWAKKYGDTGTGFSGANFVYSVTSGGYIFGGQTNNLGPSVGNLEFFVTKTDDTGAIEWSKTYGGMAYGSCNAVTPTADGGYVFAGGIAGGFGSSDIYLVKTDGQGEILWAKVYGTNTIESAKYIHETSDGGLVIAGYIGGVGDFLLMKTDGSGNVLWASAYGGNAHEGLNCAFATRDEGYLLGGYSDSFHPGMNDIDAYVVKVDSSGTLQWSKTWGRASSDEIYSIADADSTGFLFTGYSSAVIGNADVLLINADLNGNIAMSEAIGSPGVAEGGMYVRQLADEGSLILGLRGLGTVAFPIKVYAVRSDNQGVSGCNTQNPNFNVINPATVTAPVVFNVSSLDSSQDVFPFVTTITTMDSLLCASDAVTEVTPQPNYSIYPNPTDGMFTVLSDEELSELVITNSFGEVVSRTTVQDKAVIDLRGQARGIYFYTLSGKEGIRRGKIVLQ